MTYEFTNIEDRSDTVEIEADSFDHACHLLFGQGDEFDLDYTKWELTGEEA